MISCSLSVPSKTFLCGEYAALHGGPCVLLATMPRFKLIAKKNDSKVAKNPFHAASPAGMFYESRATELAEWSFAFENPLEQGGFGASTAEYLLLSAFSELHDGLRAEAQLDFDVHASLKAYRDLHQGKSVRPSGADLVAQTCGYVTAFERRSGRIQLFSWPFAHLSFVIFATGRKLATHTHLGGLQEYGESGLPTRFEGLDHSSTAVWHAMARVTEGPFVFALNEFAHALAALGLQTVETSKQVVELKKWPGVRVAKGCGAMGSDAILVIFDNRETTLADIKKLGQGMGLKLHATPADLCAGLLNDSAEHGAGVSRGVSL